MSNTKEAVEATVEKGNVISINHETKVDQKRIDEAKKKFENFANELQTKKYLVAGGKTTGQAILDFLANEAEWSAHEALGVEKAYEDVEKAMKGGKELMLPSLCIKAVSFFTGKVKGTGLAAAVKYKKELFTPLNDAMGRITNDEQQYENLRQEWAAAAQGVEVENTENNA
jgi:hypothetical protein